MFFCFQNANRSLSKSFEGESKFKYSQCWVIAYADQLLHEKYIIVTYETAIWDQEHSVISDLLASQSHTLYMLAKIFYKWRLEI